jgi:hypothetical protein
MFMQSAHYFMSWNSSPAIGRSICCFQNSFGFLQSPTYGYSSFLSLLGVGQSGPCHNQHSLCRVYAIDLPYLSFGC